MSLVIIFALFVYLLPSVIAATRKVKHGEEILFVNLFFGWTILGWIAALIWGSCREHTATKSLAPQYRDHLFI